MSEGVFKGIALVLYVGLGLLGVILIAYGASAYHNSQNDLLNRHSGKKH